MTTLSSSGYATLAHCGSGVTRLQAARELVRLTAILEDAIAVGDVGAADRLLQTRARVLADTTLEPMTAADTEALGAAARELRDIDGRVRGSLGRAIDEARAGLAAITAGSAVARLLPRGGAVVRLRRSS